MGDLLTQTGPVITTGPVVIPVDAHRKIRISRQMFDIWNLYGWPDEKVLNDMYGEERFRVE